jgi:2-isopropylmalate synthase
MNVPPAITWNLISFHTSAGTGTLPTAAVCLENAEGHRVKQAMCGDGPVDAVFKAMERVSGISPNVREYQIRSLSTGEDAQGEAILETEYNGRIYRGRASSTDIVEASARALLIVINRILRDSAMSAERSLKAVGAEH